MHRWRRSSSSSTCISWLARLWIRAGQGLTERGPLRLVRREVIDPVVGQPQLAGLFQVGHGDAPAAFEVGPQPVGDDIAQRLGDSFARHRLVGGVLVPGEDFEVVAEGGDHARVPGSRRRAARRGRRCCWSRAARYSAERTSATSTKSLKWPACRLASWRLSLNARNFRASASRSVSARRLRTTASDSTVTALARPSVPRLATRENSDCWALS